VTNLSRSSLPTRPRAWLTASILLAALIAIVVYRDAKKAAASHPQGKKILVAFEGPWAFAVDPNDANSIYAFAPKTASHTDLMVESVESQTLPAGIYELRMPAVSNRTSSLDSNVLQAKIDAQGVQHALSARFERYAIRLPRPEAYVATSHEVIRAGSTYPPGPSTEKNYVTSASLRYSVDALRGFVLVGQPDRDFPLSPLTVEPSKPIKFVIAPLPGQMDECDTHVREAFRDLARLVNLKLFVDFPGLPESCRDHDPQKPPA
jgi:hypothetical protein